MYGFQHQNKLHPISFALKCQQVASESLCIKITKVSVKYMEQKELNRKKCLIFRLSFVEGVQIQGMGCQSKAASLCNCDWWFVGARRSPFPSKWPITTTRSASPRVWLVARRTGWSQCWLHQRISCAVPRQVPQGDGRSWTPVDRNNNNNYQLICTASLSHRQASSWRFTETYA